MKRKMSVATLVALRAFVLAALSGVLLLPSSDSAAFAQSSPSVAVSLSDASVEQGTAITATMSFSNLEDDADTSTTDYIFRADVIGADECEGGGLGKTRYMYKVDEDPETRGATISTDCPAGDYTLRVSISSPDSVELASSSSAFSVTEPGSTQPSGPESIEFVPEGALASAQQAAQPTEPAVFGSISGGTVSLRWSDPGDGCTSQYQTYSRRFARWSALGRDLAPDTMSWTSGFAILVWHPEGRTFGVWCNATAVESGSRPPGRKLGEVAFFGGDHAGNAPVAPGNVSITPRDGELAVSWDAPANPSSSPIKNTIVQYQVQWKSGSEDYDASNRQAVTELPPALSHTITGLTNATEYTVRVRAVSTVHDGAWSSGAAATPAVSDDATLSSLELTSPATDLDPPFGSATVSYNAKVSTEASSITVTADTTDDGASYEVKLGGVADDDGTLSLTGAGPFTITIEVTAADKAATQTYTVTVDPDRPDGFHSLGFRIGVGGRRFGHVHPHPQPGCGGGVDRRGHRVPGGRLSRDPDTRQCGVQRRRPGDDPHGPHRRRRPRRGRRVRDGDRDRRRRRPLPRRFPGRRRRDSHRRRPAVRQAGERSNTDRHGGRVLQVPHRTRR